MTPRSSRETISHEPIAVMRAMGREPMPWQRELFDVAFEVDECGLLWYREIVVVIMRQSGKSTLVIPWGLHRMIGWQGRQFLLYMAQTRGKSLEKLVDDHFFHINASPFRKLLVPNRSGKIQPVLTNGGEHLRFVNGSKWLIDAVTEDAGHGGTYGLTIGDEIFALKDGRLEAALMPTTATIPDAQSLWISTPGKSRAASPFLWQKVEKGRARVELARQDPGLLHQSRSLYVEFSFADDVDAYDPLTWWGSMPALGYTQTLEQTKAFADSMAEPEFRRSFGCQWGDDLGQDWKIPRDRWSAVCDAGSKPGDVLVWVPDVGPDRAWASISVASMRDDGRIHVEVVDDGPGTDWLVYGDEDRGLRGLDALVRRHGGAVWFDFKTVGAFEPAFRAADLDAHAIPAQDAAVAAPALLDMVLNDRIRHRGQVELDDALSAAETRVFGDGWGWARGRSLRPITALMSVTLAARMLAKTLPELTYDPATALRDANRLREGAA